MSPVKGRDRAKNGKTAGKRTIKATLDYSVHTLVVREESRHITIFLRMAKYTLQCMRGE